MGRSIQEALLAWTGLEALDERRFGPAAARVLRAERLKAVIDQSVVNALTIGANGIVLLTAFSGHVSPTPLWTWFGILIVFGVLPPIVAVRRRGGKVYGSERAPLRLARRVLLIALIWGAAPFLLLPHAEGYRLGVLLLQMAGMMAAGTYALMGVPRAALTWIAVLAIANVSALASLGAAMWQATLLFVLFTPLLVHSVISQATVVTRRFANEQELTEQRDLTELLLADFENAGTEWCWQTDSGGLLTRVPEPLRAILGVDRELARVVPIFELIAKRFRGAFDVGRLRIRLDRREAFHDVELHLNDAQSGEERWITLRGKPIHDEEGAFLGYRGIATEVTEMRRAEETVRFLASHDALTRLANRSTLRDRLSRRLAEGMPFALLALDLDRFKAVNDTLGHPAGDELLRLVARRLEGVLRQGSGFVARAAGDEFFVVLEGDGTKDGSLTDAASELARRVTRQLSEPFEMEAGRACIGTSVGVALYPCDATSVESLFARADLALYRAKAEGRGRHVRYDPSMDHEARVRRELESDLSGAIDAGEFSLVLQPIVAIADDGRAGCKGMEAFLRWNHPVRGVVPPATFLPVAEQIGAGPRLGAWVLREAVREAASWVEELPVTVNVSASQLEASDFVATVMSALKEGGLKPDRLELDVPENALTRSPSMALDAISRLRAEGVRITLDELGARQGTLSAICALAFDRIKISPTLIEAIDAGDTGESDRARLMIGTLVDLANRLGVEATGEGIERTAQLDALRELGCAAGQGFLFARPLPPAGAALLAGGRIDEARPRNERVRIRTAAKRRTA